MQTYKVLIVEDEALERELLKRFLEAHAEAFTLVKEAAFALEALEYLDEQAVDLVITDINMPAMNGLEMVRRIRQTDTNVQVVVLTGYNDLGHAQRAIQVGVSDYLVKPLDAQGFADMLARTQGKILDQRERQAELQRRWERKLATAPKQLTDADLEQLGGLLHGGMGAEVRAWLDQRFPADETDVEAVRVRAVQVISSLYAMEELDADGRARFSQAFDLESVGEIRAFLEALAVEAAMSAERIRTVAASKQVQGVVEYMHEHMADASLTLHETAKRFFLNASYLSRIFKQSTGLAFREYLNKLRIECAMAHMDDPRVKAYEICARVGIDDPNYFSTLFKKYAGMTIKQYRAKGE